MKRVVFNWIFELIESCILGAAVINFQRILLDKIDDSP